MNEEERRKAFVNDEANLELAVDDAVEVIRALLRALVAIDPSKQTGEALARVRSLLQLYGSDFPAERVLPAAIAKLRNVDATIAEDGYVIETTLLAMKYFAEATAEETHFSSANRRRALDRYRTAIRDIDAIDQLRRLR